MAWISLSDPPFLNLPIKGESVAFRNPQNIIFQWTPRHLNSPNTAYNTEYEFTLIEFGIMELHLKQHLALRNHFTKPSRMLLPFNRPFRATTYTGQTICMAGKGTG